MEHVKLSSTLNFGIEQLAVGMRMSIFDSKSVLVCRKFRSSQLQLFINNEARVLFKGRLQLHKHENLISVHYNNQPVGQITNNQLGILGKNAGKEVTDLAETGNL